MFKYVNHSILHVILASIVLCGVQGHPHERSRQPASRHTTASLNSEAQNDEDKCLDGAMRESLINNTGTHTNNPVAESRSLDSDGKIIFPSDSHSYITERPKLNTSTVTACKNTTYCENPPHYPKQFIAMAIKKRDDLKYLAIIDTVPEIGQRVDSGNDESLCSYEDIVVFPKSAENKAKQWLYIINEENFPQGVRIESCMTENTACHIIEGLIEGYETSCKQKYVYRQLAAITPEGSVGADYFRFPASCCCHIKFTGNPTSRLGINLDKSGPQSPAHRKVVSRAGKATSARRK